MQRLPLFILTSIFLFFSSLGHCQITDEELEKIPANYTNLLFTRENEKGLVMSYKQFKKGSFVEASEKEKSTYMTTMLLGSATYLHNYLLNKYSDFKPVVIQSNGFTTTSFKIKYQFSGCEIFIMRIFKAERKQNPMAAEDPENYILLYGFDIKEEKKLNEITDLLIQHSKDTNIAFKKIERNKIN